MKNITLVLSTAVHNDSLMLASECIGVHSGRAALTTLT